MELYYKLGRNKRLEKAQIPINGAFAIMEKYGSDDNTYRVMINGFMMPLHQSPWLILWGLSLSVLPNSSLLNELPFNVRINFIRHSWRELQNQANLYAGKWQLMLNWCYHCVADSVILA